MTGFNYLGVTFTKNGKFKLTKQKNIEKATKAMYEVIRRGKRHNLSIECLLGLFDKIVNKGNNKITELRTILQRESQNS